MAAQAWPAMAGWLAPATPTLNKLIVMRALCDLGICESPEGSNRSGRIDEYNRRAGAPMGSYWCASWASACWEDCNADLPGAGRASCDVLWDWAKRNGLFQHFAVEGALVLYGATGDANHVGIVIRVKPYVISIEGNASWGVHSRNGEAVVCRRVDPGRVLGYVVPRLRNA